MSSIFHFTFYCTHKMWIQMKLMNQMFSQLSQWKLHYQESPEFPNRNYIVVVYMCVYLETMIITAWLKEL